VNSAEKLRAALDGLALNPLDVKGLLKTFGLIGVWAIMFAETGLLVGFFLPGDSLLFLAGVAASPVAHELVGTELSLVGLLIGAPICAIAGAQLGYFLGAKYGRRMFARPDSRFFKLEYVSKAEYYFTKFGPAKAVVLARFIPIVRTFLNRWPECSACRPARSCCGTSSAASCGPTGSSSPAMRWPSRSAT
jgi:membrane-associated protein